MYGQFSLATGLSSLLAYRNKVPDLLLYRKLLRFMNIRVQLVILTSAFVAGSTLWWVFCLPHVVLCAQLFVKVGARPRALWFRTHCLGTAPRWWRGVRLSERRKSLSLVHGQSPGMGSGAPLPFPAICENKSTCHPCPMESPTLQVKF